MLALGMTRTFRCPHCGHTHQAGVTVCPTTRQPIGRRPTRSYPGPTGAGAERPGLVVPRPMSARSAAAPPRGPAPLPARRSLVGQTIDGKYRITAVLGEGGMGSVFEAEHVAIGRAVAVKVLHPAQARKKVAVKRFHQEARAAGAIGHPNICEVYDIGTLPDGSPYLVMERLRGETLSARLAAEGGLPFAEAIDILIPVLSALGAAHGLGILHRDIKPENVFLAERPGFFPAGRSPEEADRTTTVKLLDFGVSKVLAPMSTGEWEEETDLTKTGMVMGTPYYMSPEQARGDRNLDARVDLYACGVLLYELLTGRRPFTASNYNALLLQILTQEPPLPSSLRPTIPASLEAVIAKAMAKNRDERFGSALELQQALVRARSELIRASGTRTPVARVAAPTPGPASVSSASVEIPITFVEAGATPVEAPAAKGDDWDHPTTPRMPAPDVAPDDLPSSPYDDEEGANETVRIDPAKLAAKPPIRRKPSDPGFDAEDTARMETHEVEQIAAALREAREKERAKRRGGR